MKLLILLFVVLLVSAATVPVLKTERVRLVSIGEKSLIPTQKRKKLKGWQKR